MDFTGKTVWVTGASSGIGEAVARALAARGAAVVLSGRRVDALERLTLEALEGSLRGLVDVVSEDLLLLDFLNLVDVRVVLVVDVDLARVDELSVAADSVFGVLVADQVLGVAEAELVENDRGRLLVHIGFLDMLLFVLCVLQVALHLTLLGEHGVSWELLLTKGNLSEWLPNYLFLIDSIIGKL